MILVFWYTIITIHVLNFAENIHVFDLKEKKSWGINFCGHGSMVGTIIVRFAKHASYCGLIFMDNTHNRHTTKSTKFYTP